MGKCSLCNFSLAAMVRNEVSFRDLQHNQPRQESSFAAGHIIVSWQLPSFPAHRATPTSVASSSQPINKTFSYSIKTIYEVWESLEQAYLSAKRPLISTTNPLRNKTSPRKPPPRSKGWRQTDHTETKQVLHCYPKGSNLAPGTSEPLKVFRSPKPIQEQMNEFWF